MKLLKVVLILFLVTGCANTEDVDDSDVQDDMAASQGQSVDDSEDSSDGEDVVAETPAPAPVKQNTKGTYVARGEAADLLYNIASSALKKADNTLSYSVKCTYAVKPLSIKGCMVKTGFLPADAKNKIGKLLLEAKNLPRKKSGNNEASVTTNYSCTKGKSSTDTVCSLDKTP